MKREILFRGQVKYNGNHLFTWDWVYGSLIVKTGRTFIHVIEEDSLGNIVREFDVEVIPETVGQFTEYTDRNGVKIFEDDIFDSEFDDGSVYIIKWNSNLLKFSVCLFGYKMFHNSNGGEEYANNITLLDDDVDEVKNFTGEPIIGNIYSNPELLKK